jgi:DNA-directed RNA polymerase I, II, and III subunit RPABC1
MEGYDKVFRAYCKALKMLKARHYNIPEELTKEDFSTFHDRLLNAQGSKQSLTKVFDHGPDRILLQFPDEENLNVPLVAKFSKTLSEQNARRGILITRGLATGMAKSAIEELVSSAILIEHFEEDQLIELHDFSNELEIEILNAVDREAFKNRFRIEEQDVPKLEVTDPAARFYGVNQGDLLKLTRREPEGDFITYRLAK